MPGGRPSISKFGIPFGMTRNANEICPRCLKALTRNRGRSLSWNAMSRSPVCLKASRRSGERLPTTSIKESMSLSVRIAYSSRGLSAPSRRRIGGRPTFRWMSLAPSSTARLSRELSSMAGFHGHRHVSRAALGPGRPGIPCQAGETIDHLHRSSACALGLTGVGDLAQQKLLDHPPGEGKAKEGEHRAWIPVERDLGAPARRGERIELPPDRQ